MCVWVIALKKWRLMGFGFTSGFAAEMVDEWPDEVQGAKRGG